MGAACVGKACIRRAVEDNHNKPVAVGEDKVAVEAGVDMRAWCGEVAQRADAA